MVGRTPLLSIPGQRGNEFKKAKGNSIMVTYFVVNGRVIAHDVVLHSAGIRSQLAMRAEFQLQKDELIFFQILK